MDLHAHTEHRRIDQKKPRSDELLPDVLTGHGCYGAFLYKYGHNVHEACPKCHNEREMAEHINFTFSRYGINAIAWSGQWDSRQHPTIYLRVIIGIQYVFSQVEYSRNKDWLREQV